MNPKDWSLTDRQERFTGWYKQHKVSHSTALLAGAGGIGSNALKILTRYGFGQIIACDRELVEDSNRNRQEFLEEDVGKPKAHQVLKNVAPYAVCPTLLHGYYGPVEELLEEYEGRFDIIMSGVEGDGSCVDIARYGLRVGIPVVFAHVSRDGEAFRIFIQRPGHACFGCYKPRALKPAVQRNQQCTPSPAISDVLFAAVGFACRAVVGEICECPISDEWNCRDITLWGFDMKKLVQRNPHCSICRTR